MDAPIPTQHFLDGHPTWKFHELPDHSRRLVLESLRVGLPGTCHTFIVAHLSQSTFLLR